MTPPGRSDPDAVGNARAASDLSARAADTVDLVVAMVNDRAIRPAIIAARALVFGMLAAVLGIVVVVVASVALVRVLEVYVFEGRVWAAEALLGIIFVAAGLFLWSLRPPRVTAADRPG
jgi:predicted anti-sigma-YlaC factor YlaD